MVNSITEKEFTLFRKFIYEYAGIDLSPAKQTMVGSRLSKRVNYYQLDNYRQYYDLVMGNDNPQELQMLVNILTTNETYFFREPKHFDYLRDNVLKGWSGGPFRIWSAASSSGEEAYSLAMLLADTLSHRPWEIIGSDLSTKVLTKATKGVYMMDRLDLLDEKYLKKYCQKGVRSQEGTLRVVDSLRKHTRFGQVNLMKPLPASIGMFDVIFLRNVLIYFDNETKKSVVERVVSKLKPGGLFFISHSETLNRVTDMVKMVQPSIYIKND
ncbi:MAG: SAM-dependent methyltransferase [Gammaproteobacteria bacterium]|nr:MAG: SAM-dependent methyltransferase [Gammaproteobacteria bacterium]